MSVNKQYIAFLRGINVGGHHKVPMSELKEILQKKLKFKNVMTLLNSGNVIFESLDEDITELESRISRILEISFGFPIPTLIRPATEILDLIDQDPFKHIEIHKDIRLYVSFLKVPNANVLKTPWQSPNKDFYILSNFNNAICSVLDLSITKTPKAMLALEKIYGKDITTRNWKTLKRIEKKLSADL